MGAMEAAGGGRAGWVAAGLLLVVFAGTGIVAAGAPDDRRRPPVEAADGSWPACGSVRGRSAGCFAVPGPPVTTSTDAVTTTSAAGRACRASDLRVTGGTSQGAGGTRYTGLGFTNRSSSACALAGHPTVAFLDRSGRVLGEAVPTPLPGTVTVAPGQYATASLGVASMSLGACRPVTPARLRIGLPAGGSLSIPAGDFAFCPGEDPGISHFSGPYS